MRVLEALWRADELGSPVSRTLSTGHPELDAELPGGGWPCSVVTELLQAQPGVLEWRLLGRAMRAVTARDVVLVGPPRALHAAGLAQAGLDDRRLVWLQAQTPAERLWCAEQLVRAGCCGVIIAWLPQARPEQIRRLQVAAQASAGPIFLCRPLATQHEASAAPLRVHAALGADWDIDVHVLKRRGAMHEGLVRLTVPPASLAAVLTPRLARPSQLRSRLREAADAVGCAAAVHARHAALP